MNLRGSRAHARVCVSAVCGQAAEGQHIQFWFWRKSHCILVKLSRDLGLLLLYKNKNKAENQ